MINENMLMKHIPGIMAYSCEFSQMKVRSKERLDIFYFINPDRLKEIREGRKEGSEQNILNNI